MPLFWALLVGQYQKKYKASFAPLVICGLHFTFLGMKKIRIEGYAVFLNLFLALRHPISLIALKPT